MFRIIVSISLYLIFTGGIWAGFTVWLEKKGYSVSQWTQSMLEGIPLFSLENGGWFILMMGFVALILTVTLKRVGIFDKFVEWIDEVGRFSRFRIMPRFVSGKVDLYEPSFLNIAVQVKNIGSNTSNLTDWELLIKTKDGRDFKGSPVYHKGIINVKTGNQGHLIFSEKEALYKLTQSPISPGVSITGVMQFKISGLSQEEINEDECIIILKALDNKDGEIKSMTTIGEIKSRGHQLISELHNISVNSI